MVAEYRELWNNRRERARRVLRLAMLHIFKVDWDEYCALWRDRWEAVGEVVGEGLFWVLVRAWYLLLLYGLVRFVHWAWLTPIPFEAVTRSFRN